MKNTRLVFPAKDRCELEDVELDEKLDHNQLLTRTKVSLISAGTELSMFTGTHRMIDDPSFKWAKYPFRPGYCAVGEVLSSTSAAFKPGQLVLHRREHAAFAKLNQEEAIAVPEGATPETAVFHPMAQIAMAAPRVSPIGFGGQVVVIGMGVVGNLCAQLCQLAGAAVVAGADLLERRLAVARGCGISRLFDCSQKALNEWVKELGPIGAEWVVEAVGSTRTIADALQCVADRGKVVLLGSPRTPMQIDPYVNIHRTGISVIGAHGRNVDAAAHTRDTPLLMEWLRAGKLRVEPLITHRLAMKEAAKAYAGLRDHPQEYLGVVLTY